MCVNYTLLCLHNEQLQQRLQSLSCTIIMSPEMEYIVIHSHKNPLKHTFVFLTLYVHNSTCVHMIVYYTCV